jgi:acyl-CoA thioester hydrolase
MTEPTTDPIIKRAARPAPGRRADYAVFLTIPTRWMDNDVFGHINNVHYYSYIDTAICHALMRCGILQWTGGSHFLMLAESGCRYHSEAAFPDVLTAGLRLATIGTSSMRNEVGIFREGAEVASAEGFMVHVCVEAATRRPAPMPAAWRDALQTLRG